MGLQRVALREAFVAYFAFVRAHFRVDSHVLDERRLHGERFIARGARIRFHAGVDS